MTDPTNVHPVRTVRVGDRSADIDEMLAPLVEALWRNGFQTFTSCQDAGESNADWVDLLPHMAAYVESRKGWAFIDLPMQDGLRFLTAVAQAGPRDAFYVEDDALGCPACLGRHGQTDGPGDVRRDHRVEFRDAVDAGLLSCLGPA